MRSFLIFGILFAVVIQAQMLKRASVDVHEAYVHTSGWTKLRAAHPKAEIKLQFAIKQRNLDILDRIFWDVSEPTSKSYGKHLSRDELTELLAPEEHVLQEIDQWISQYPIISKKLSPNKDMLTVVLPSESAQEVVGAEFHEYEHETTGRKFLRSMGPYTVPKDVHQHFDYITGHLGLPTLIEPNVFNTFNPVARDSVTITPAILRLRYNISKTETGGNPGNLQAVAEFQDNFFSQPDLDQFFAQFWPENHFNSTLQKIIGANDHSKPTVQANEDVQYMMGVAPNVPTWFYANDGTDFWSDLSEWLNILSASTYIPLVHSFTSGNQGNGQSQDYRLRVNIEFQKLGVRGVSILVATGDKGTGCSVCYYFEPTFPATSPYVTTVGSTAFDSSSVGAEASTYSFGSGGGFSWTFDQPDYQVKAVTKYFASNPMLPESHYYNREGRGIPDVSALGVDYHIVVNGQNIVTRGTGVATTTFAAIVSLLNEARLNALKAPLGFLNPFLYATHENHKDAFFDVTKGNNHYGCCGYTGFSAGEGWDPVSGLGTPNFIKLKQVVRELNY